MHRQKRNGSQQRRFDPSRQPESIGEAIWFARAAYEPDHGRGISTVQQYLQANLIDSLHFALSPVVLGQGEAVFTVLTCALLDLL